MKMKPEDLHRGQKVYVLMLPRKILELTYIEGNEFYDLKNGARFISVDQHDLFTSKAYAEIHMFKLRQSDILEQINELKEELKNYKNSLTHLFEENKHLIKEYPEEFL